ncbi:MAG: YggT family protein [Deltaproteobacteria bacterium]|nr:YggT family protein [Deltaproteobacteria bacterium]
MFVLSNLIVALAKIIDIALTLYMWIIIFRALISWVNADPYNQIVIFLYRVTEPVLGPIRRKLPMGNMGIDFSPVIVLLIILFLKYFLVETMIQLAQRI